MKLQDVFAVGSSGINRIVITRMLCATDRWAEAAPAAIHTFHRDRDEDARDMSNRFLDALMCWALRSPIYGWLGNKVVVALAGKPSHRGEADDAVDARVWVR